MKKYYLCPKCKELRKFARMTGADQNLWRGPENCSHGFFTWWRRLHRYMVNMTDEQEDRFAKFAGGVLVGFILTMAMLRLLGVLL